MLFERGFLSGNFDMNPFLKIQCFAVNENYAITTNYVRLSALRLLIGIGRLEQAVQHCCVAGGG